MDGSPLSVTPLYAGILALLYAVLTYRVILARRAGGVSLGDGGDAELERRIRAHGNFAEYAPLCMVLLIVLELGSAEAWLLHVGGLLLVVGRSAHAVAISRAIGVLRVFGMVSTLTVLIGGGVRAIALAL